MLLLDTHAFLWFEGNDPRLPQNVMVEIQTNEHVFISVVSFWEIAIKSSLGKLELQVPIDEMMEKSGFFLLPIKASHLKKLVELPWIHRDPFDRLLISQAKSEGLKLVTKDENIKKYDGVETIWSE